MSWASIRPEARDAVSTLLDQLSDNTADESNLIDVYLDARTSLARAFAELAGERFSDDGSLDAAVELVTTALTAVGEVPDRYRRVRRYSGSHRILLTFLSRNVETPVTAAKVMMVNGEQTETGRRVRELRELGFTIETTRLSGQDHFVLRSGLPDAALGARHQIAYQIKNDMSLSKDERKTVLEQFGVHDL